MPKGGARGPSVRGAGPIPREIVLVSFTDLDVHLVSIGFPNRVREATICPKRRRLSGLPKNQPPGAAVPEEATVSQIYRSGRRRAVRRPPLPRSATILASATAFALLGLAACSFAPEPVVPAPAAALPATYEADIAGEDPAPAEPIGDPPLLHAPLDWWTAFQDPVLNAVVDTALASNFDLAAAVARVRQARAQARVARAALLPSVQLSAGASDQNAPANTGLGGRFRELALGGTGGDSAAAALGLDRFAFSTWSVGADFSYEIDFWGRARNDARAAGADHLATEADFETARIGVLAETITAYFEIAALRRQTALARETADLLAEREALAEARYDRGLATSLELYQLRRDRRAAQAALPSLETALATSEGRLAVLLGRYRKDLTGVFPASGAPALLHAAATPAPIRAVGTPAQLLLQRPDVAAAYRRLEAARYRVGARRAALLPSLSLSGSLGVQSADAGGLFDVDQWFRNLLANLTAPLFRGGRLRSEVAQAQARFEEAAATYGRTVVTAVHEAESALETLRNEQRRHDFLAAQRAEAQASADLQADRYASGVSGYAGYLDAHRTLLGVESEVAGAGRDLALARLAVHRALGGAWTAADRFPEPHMVPMPGTTGAAAENHPPGAAS